MNDSESSGERSDANQQTDEQRSQVQRDFLRNAPSIRNILRSLNPSFTDAEDLFQELFLLVAQKADQFTPGTNFLGWVYTIAKFQVLSVNRKNARRSKLLQSEVAEALFRDAPKKPSELFEAKVESLRDCIQLLAPTARTVMNMRYFEDMKPGKIAEELQIDVDRVYLILSRSRTLLRKCVDQQLPARMS